jgi:hypothetical protein
LEGEAAAAMQRIVRAREALDLVRELREKREAMTSAGTRGEQSAALHRWRNLEAKLAAVLETVEGKEG